MKKIIYYMLIVLLGLSACTKNVLDKQPLTNLGDGAVWNDPNLMNAYVAQLYSNMGFMNDMEFGQGLPAGTAVHNGFSVTNMSVMSDEAQPGWEFSGDGYPADRWWRMTISGGTGSGVGGFPTNIGEWWGYPQIRAINTFFANAPTSILTIQNPTALKGMIGEAYFLRAFSYFNMVKRYGGVPIITNVQSLTDPNSQLYPKRNNEEDVYNLILSDLDSSIYYFNAGPSTTVLGHANKWAALALKGRAAMYAASVAEWGTVELNGLIGIPTGDAQKFWQASYSADTAIKNSGLFTLYNKVANKSTNFRQSFLDPTSPEIIFTQQFSGPVKGGIYSSWDLYNDPYGYSAFGAGTGGQAQLFLDMVESFDNIDGTPGILNRDSIAAGHLWTTQEMFGNKDPRFRASVFAQGSPWLGDSLQTYLGLIQPDGTVISSGSYMGVSAFGKATNTARSGHTPFSMAKYVNEANGIAGSRASVQAWIVFRYGETLLNLAEASFELGNAGEALGYINQIRTRAGMPTLSSITRDQIRHERKIELAFEGNRYFDLLRWRIADNVLSTSFSSLNLQLDYNTKKFKLSLIPNVEGLPTPTFAHKNYHWPITTGRTANNPNLVENPGWQ